MRVLAGGKEEFTGLVELDIKARKLILRKDRDEWLKAEYRLAGDVLTLEIDGDLVEYRRRK